MLKKSTLAAATAALATFAIGGSAFAASPLAQYSQAPGNNGPSLSYTDGTLSTTGTGDATQFNFQVTGLPTQDLAATLTLTGTASGDAYQETGPGGTYDVQPLSGMFSFVYTGSTPFTVGTQTYTTGTTLLAGTFANSLLDGVDMGTTGSLTNSRLAGGTLTFTSGISEIKFGTGDEGMSIALNSVLPGFYINGANLADFTATSVGNFAADVTISGGGGGVPEVGTWALMILGCGIAGAQIRARRSALVKS